MPTPIDWFLRKQKAGDERRQLGASQEWDWRTGNYTPTSTHTYAHTHRCTHIVCIHMHTLVGRFYGFVDRDEYLCRVRMELCRRENLVDPRDRSSYTPSEDGIAGKTEAQRRKQNLVNLQSALQNRKVKIKILKQQQVTHTCVCMH